MGHFGPWNRDDREWSDEKPMRNSEGARTETGRFDDRQMETVMGRLLQVGVLFSSLVVLVGGTLYVRAHYGSLPNYRVFSSEPTSLRQLSGIGSGIAAGDPGGIIQLGVLLLIATPVARVIFAIVGFAIERDRLYVVVSVTVLTVLLAGLFWSH